VAVVGVDRAGGGSFGRGEGAYGVGGSGDGVGGSGDGAGGIDGTVAATPQICLSVAGLSFPVPHNEFAVFWILLPLPSRYGVKSPKVRYS
jgi:hypothetical protein